MANAFVKVLSDPNGDTNMQGYSGSVSGNTVFSEAVVLVNSNLSPIGVSGAPLVVDASAASVNVNAGTNLNTALLALESGGNLATLAGGVASSKYQVNIAQIAGGTAATGGQTGSFQVGGAVTNATAVSSATNPIIVAGSDYQATPKVQFAKVDSSGGMYINVLGTPTVVQANASNFQATVTGTVTAIQSNASNLQATVVPGSGNFAENLVQIGGNTVNTGTGTTGAGTQRVVIATDQPSFSNNVPISVKTFTGAANLFNNQINATTTAGTLVSARATRRSVSIRNIDNTNQAWIGLATVSNTNGMLLNPGDSISVDYVGAIQVVAGANNAVMAYIETFD